MKTLNRGRGEIMVRACRWIMFIVVVLGSGSGCADLKIESIGKNGEHKMSGVCDLPEDLSAFERYIASKVGDQISLASIEVLRAEMELTNESLVHDPIYSRTEKVRLFQFSKKCAAPDGVIVEWLVLATIDPKGDPVFHQYYLLYAHEDIFQGKRRFAFDRVRGTGADYSRLISKELVGIMNDRGVDEYMRNLGAIRSKSHNVEKSYERYDYKIDAKNDMGSRLALYDFSPLILVMYGPDRIVKEVVVRH